METTNRRSMLKLLALAPAMKAAATPAASSAATPAASSAATPAASSAAAHSKQEEADVAPGEDLMREHGVLRRVMFLYDDAAVKLEAGQKPPLDALASAAQIVRKVIEQYHEKLEENFIFPRMEKARKHADLTAILRRQHVAGREVTARILKLCDGNDGAQLARLLRSFNRMYRPHAAREDTVLFPAFHDLMGDKAYAELGEQFEDEEKKQLGSEGFEGAVAQIAKLEEQFGLADLDQFTPR